VPLTALNITSLVLLLTLGMHEHVVHWRINVVISLYAVQMMIALVALRCEAAHLRRAIRDYVREVVRRAPDVAYRFENLDEHSNVDPNETWPGPHQSRQLPVWNSSELGGSTQPLCGWYTDATYNPCRVR